MPLHGSPSRKVLLTGFASHKKHWGTVRTHEMSYFWNPFRFHVFEGVSVFHTVAQQEYVCVWIRQGT